MHRNVKSLKEKNKMSQNELFRTIRETLNTHNRGFENTAIQLKKIWTEIDKINDRLDQIQKRGNYREYGESPYQPRRIDKRYL